METLVWNQKVFINKHIVSPSLPHLTSNVCMVRSSSRYKSSSIRHKLGVTCAVKEINETEFPETVLNSHLPVLVEFVANWCGPCRLISPAVASLAQLLRPKYLDLCLEVQLFVEGYLLLQHIIFSKEVAAKKRMKGAEAKKPQFIIGL